jgi:hypothetical protein
MVHGDVASYKQEISARVSFQIFCRANRFVSDTVVDPLPTRRIMPFSNSIRPTSNR